MVKVCVLSKDSGVVADVIKKVTATITESEIVNNPGDADLVVTESVRQIESLYNKEQFYAVLTLEKAPDRTAENVRIINILDFLPGYAQFISEIAKKKSGAPDETGETIAKDSLRPDAKSILVIDDTPKHRESARKLLAGHKLTIASGYEEAMELLGKEKFEVVLSDLYLPMSSKTLSDKAFRLGELVPYGLLLMIEAARQGAKRVAVVTNLNHHADHFSAAFDHFSQFAINIEGAKVMMLHARLQDGAKDWANALEVITSP